MIFVTLGSQKNPFNRLLRALDEQIASGQIEEEVFAQTGYSDYEPANYGSRHFLDHDEYEKYQDLADIVIAHGGTGAIMGALKKGKKVIAVPRKYELGEHNDDHQIQMVSELAQEGLITACLDTDELGMLIKKVRENPAAELDKAYHSNTAGYLSDIEKFIDGINEVNNV